MHCLLCYASSCAHSVQVILDVDLMSYVNGLCNRAALLTGYLGLALAQPFMLSPSEIVRAPGRGIVPVAIKRGEGKDGGICLAV